MRIYTYVLTVVLCVSGSGIYAQTLKVLEKAVGGFSMRSVHQQAVVQAQLRGTVAKRVLPTDLPASLPQGTRLKGSLSGVLNGYARLPGNATQFSLPQLPEVKLTAVEIYHPTFVRNERVFLPKGSYAIKMPDGDYRFFTKDVPASPELTAQIERARFGEMLEFDFKELPVRPVWNGPKRYTSQDALAQDVIKNATPMAHYSQYAFMGPVDVYEVPAGVEYVPDGNYAPLVLDPQGPWVLVVFEKTSRGQLIKKDALQQLVIP